MRKFRKENKQHKALRHDQRYRQQVGGHIKLRRRKQEELEAEEEIREFVKEKNEET